MKKRRKSASDRKEANILVRVTAEQKKLFRETAARDGLGMSAWLVMTGLQRARL